MSNTAQRALGTRAALLAVAVLAVQGSPTPWRAPSVGMSRTQVLGAAGLPSSVGRGIYGILAYEHWRYPFGLVDYDVETGRAKAVVLNRLPRLP